jgi:hypothetical protein
LAKIAGTCFSTLVHFELGYTRPGGCRAAPRVRYALEKAGIEFVGDDCVRFPRSWNGDLQTAMMPYQKELRRLDKFRMRVRRLEMRNQAR